MKKFKQKATIIYLERLKNSYYGNPKYQVILQDENNNIFKGVTQTNTSVGYSITNYKNDLVTLTMHYTKNYKLIIDYIER